MFDVLHSSRYPAPGLPRICGTNCINIANNTIWIMLGDSITDAHLYSNYFQSYFHLRYPLLSLHFRDEGRGGANIPESFTAPNGENRYERRVFAWSPTIVSINFGFNNSGTQSEFGIDLNNLIGNYVTTINNAISIPLGPHPTYTPSGGVAEGQYSDEIVTIGNNRNLVYTDIWHLLHPIWLANMADPTPVDLGWTDTVHPGPAGHLAIAYEHLFKMQANGMVSSATMNSIVPSVTTSTNAIISSLTTNAFNGIDFSRLDSCLPMAFDDSARPVFELMPQIYDLNQYMLTVTGLISGNYQVYIDGVLSSTKTNTQLNNGWNMTDMTVGPIHDQLIEVLGRIRDKEGVDRITRENLFPHVGVVEYQSAADNGYNNLGLRRQDLIDYLNSRGSIAGVITLDNLIYSAAQPINRAFSIRKI